MDIALSRMQECALSEPLFGIARNDERKRAIECWLSFKSDSDAVLDIADAYIEERDSLDDVDEDGSGGCGEREV